MSNALPYSEWFNILENKIIDIGHVNAHWDFLCHGDRALWARLYFYYEKSDKENKEIWNELEITLKKREITEPGQLMSIFGTVLDMIENQCCPDAKLTGKKAFRYATFYLEHIQLSPKCNRFEYVFLTDARSYCTYEHHGRKLAFFADFKIAVSEKIQRCKEETITVNFKRFLDLLRADEEDFDVAWFKENLQEYDLFSGQDSQKLLDALLVLPPKILWYRAHELISYLNSRLLGDTCSMMLPFWEQFVQKAQAFLDKTNSDVDRTKLYDIRILCKDVNLILAEYKEKHHTKGEVKK